LGVEQITLYRQEVLTARAAAAAGFPVLRYHARGHGDSTGASADVTLASLVADARAAADEAKRRSGATRVIWLGVRLGALVAALAGGPQSGRDDGAGFILWEPISKPAEFFRQQLRTLLFSQVAGGKKPDATVDQLLARLESEGSIDVLGYALYRSLVHSFGDANLAAALAGVHAPVCLAQVQARGRLAPAHVALIGALQGAPEHAPAEASGMERVNGDAGHAEVATANIQQEPGYQEMSNPAWQCDPLTQVTLEWLDALA
ncbi:MAG: alpha/beta hydrolase, partial [Candidatus Eisenbacteria bacterium]